MGGGSSIPLRRGAEYPENARLQLAGAGSPAADAIPEPSSNPYYGPSDEGKPLTRHGLLVLVTIVVVFSVAIGTVLGFALYVTPVTHSFSGTADTIATPPTFSFPNGVSVTVHWQSDIGGPIAFSITGSSGVVYNGTGVSGAATFTANGGPYTFQIWDSPPGDPYGVSFNGYYQAPTL